MAERGGRPDQVLRATVTLTGCVPGRESEVSETFELITSEPAPLTKETFPLVVLERTSREKADRAGELLRAAGGIVTIEDVWTSPEEAPDDRPRPACPRCGSARVQPFTHAGPGARVNMKCTNCSHLFRSTAARR